MDAAAEPEVGKGRPVEVQSSACTQRVSSRLAEPLNTVTGEPAATGQPRISVSVVATRLTIVTEVSHRSVSSMTAGISARSWRTRSSASGRERSARRQLPMTR